MDLTVSFALSSIKCDSIYFPKTNNKFTSDLDMPRNQSYQPRPESVPVNFQQIHQTGAPKRPPVFITVNINNVNIYYIILNKNIHDLIAPERDRRGVRSNRPLRMHRSVRKHARDHLDERWPSAELLSAEALDRV